MSVCSGCSGTRVSNSDCKSQGKNCCYSIWDYTDRYGQRHTYETCMETTDPRKEEKNRADDVINGEGTVHQNSITCSQYHLKFELLSLLLLLFF